LLADLASDARANISTAEFCDIREVISAASEAALATMEQQSVEILLDVPDGIDLPLVRSHIERVFFNLMPNAFEAMAGCGTVRIGARKAETSVLIELEDTGPGIPTCISDRLFEPLITSGKQDGLGLGLALARQTVSQTTAATCGLSQPPAPVSLSAFHWIASTMFLDRPHFRKM